MEPRINEIKTDPCKHNRCTIRCTSFAWPYPSYIHMYIRIYKFNDGDKDKNKSEMTET